MIDINILLGIILVLAITPIATTCYLLHRIKQLVELVKVNTDLVRTETSRTLSQMRRKR